MKDKQTFVRSTEIFKMIYSVKIDVPYFFPLDLLPLLLVIDRKVS